MKIAGYTACYNAIMAAKLPQPIKYNAFTVYFDRHKLDAIRDTYSAYLYKECLQDAEKAAYEDFSELEQATAE